MADESTAERVRKLIADKLDRSYEEVDDKSHLMDDLGADSLDITELLMAFEEEFDIDIGEDANSIETVGGAIEYIEGLVK